MYYVSKRTDRDGLVYFSFSYDDPQTGKRIRLKKETHPLFRDRAEAKAWADSQDAQRVARLESLARREAWKSTYYDFHALYQRYETYLKERQSRSHSTYLAHFQNYVMEYFLGQRQASNPNNWYVLFPEFRDWLQTANTLSGKLLAPATRNHIIVSLNNFLTMLDERGLMDHDCYKKCSLFPQESEANMRDASHVVALNEYLDMKERLRAANPAVADAFIVLYHTGLRINEMMGLNLASMFPGDVQDGRVKRELDKAGKDNYYGYIYLLHQPKDKHRKRLDDHSIERAPLKGRKTISPKHARTIPIFDKEAWNVLARRYKDQTRLKEKPSPPYGTDEENYILFEELALSTFTATLEREYNKTGYKEKTPHDLRHTYTTNLVGETGSPFLARLILGHRKESTQERYLHIYEQISQNAQKAKNKIDVID